MDAELETLVVAAYVFATSLSIPRPGPPGLDHRPGADRARSRPGDDRPCKRSAVPWDVGAAAARMVPAPARPDAVQPAPAAPDASDHEVQLTVAELIAEGRVRLVDGTLIGCANYPGCAKRSEFAPQAGYGYCPSKSQFVWGMRLVVICDREGVPVGYDLAGPKTGQERESAYRLAERPPGSLLFADGGFWGSGVQQHDGADRRSAHHARETQARRAPAKRDRQGPHPPGDRVACSPTSNARCAWKSTSPRRRRASPSESCSDCSP